MYKWIMYVAFGDILKAKFREENFSKAHFRCSMSSDCRDNNSTQQIKKIFTLSI